MEQEHLPIVLPMLDRMRLAPDDNVLDIGCGTGWLASLIAEQLPEGRVIGLDISDEMVRRARHHNDEIENTMFIVGDAAEIPWDAQFFNQVVSVESAYYWPDPARALREIFSRAARGRFGLAADKFLRREFSLHNWAQVADVPLQLLSAEEWGRLFRDAGFTDISWEQIPIRRPCLKTTRAGGFATPRNCARFARSALC